MTDKSNRRISFGLALSSELFDKIEAERGMVPRTRYVEYLIRKSFENKVCQCEMRACGGPIVDIGTLSEGNGQGAMSSQPSVPEAQAEK